MHRNFLIPGAFKHLEGIAEHVNDSVCGILVMAKDKSSGREILDRAPGDFADRVYALGCLSGVQAYKPAPEEQAIFEKCLHYAFSDSRVHYLAIRSSLDSAFNNAVLIAQILRNCIRVIRDTRATRLIASSPPHSLHSWLLAKCFECMELPVYFFERTPVNDRAWICQGSDDHQIVTRDIDSQSPASLTETTQNLIRTQRESAPGLRDKDGFYLSRMDLSTIEGADSNAWWSWRREARWMLSGKFVSMPLRMASSYRKRQLFKSYTALSSNTLPSGPYIVYFMHYQPERSSVPDGLFFGQQWLVLELLSACLPEGWSLVVREHPTTWYKPVDLTVRRRNFYSDLLALGNVALSSMDVDTFEIIDRSQAVATLTGSVGLQAILRNRPVLSLGLPTYKDHPACLPIRGAADLNAAIAAIQARELDGAFSDEALENFFAWVEQNSVNADPTETDWMKARIKNFAFLYGEVLSGNSPLDR